MPSNTFGEHFRITTFGESHGPALGAVIDGVRPGLAISLSRIQKELNRRRPGTSSRVSSRREPDRVEILSGVYQGKTTGAPIALLIRNKDARPGDYRALASVFRPGHADFAVLAKYGIRDPRGSGRFSGRETVSRVAAGVIARETIRHLGISILSRVAEAGGETLPRDQRRAIHKAKSQGDSIGGIVDLCISGVPAGLGDPVFDKLSARLGEALLSIGAVKGIEFGDGFALARLRGSEANDSLLTRKNKKALFSSNHLGGLTCGISNGQDIRIRLALRPPSSIAKPQRMLDTQGHVRTVSVKGRHDPFLGERIRPVAEAMVALVLADAILAQQRIRQTPPTIETLRLQIDQCDAQIIEALRTRLALVTTIGHLKRKRKIPIIDRAREKVVRQCWLDQAAQSTPTIPSAPLQRMLRLITQMSIEQQSS